MTSINEFTNLYPVSKTLRWSLKPVGKTEHFIREMRILENDRQKAETYVSAKRLLDNVYKAFINSALLGIEADSKNYKTSDFVELANALDEFQKDKVLNREALYKASAKCRTMIVNHMKTMKEFNSFAGSGKAKDILAHAYEMEEGGELKSVFDRFSGYFNGYCQNRANLFSVEAKASAIGYRLVDENFPKYYRNSKTLKLIEEKAPDLYSEICRQMGCHFGINDVKSFFSIENYHSFMIQSGIDEYNLALGGKTEKDSKVKIQGINELVNLYCQINPDVKRREFLLVPLFKQLLEERTSMSFIPKQCDSDEELISTIRDTSVLIDSMESSLKIISHISDYDTAHVFLSGKQIPTLSNAVYGSGLWNRIFDNMIQKKKSEFSGSGKITKQQQKVLDGCTKLDFYPIDYLESVCSDGQDCDISIIGSITSMANGLQEKLSVSKIEFEGREIPKDIRADSEYVSSMKSFLDSILEVSRFINSFNPSSDYETDSVFYGCLEGFGDTYRQISRVYDFTRNYITKKNSIQDKFKLNFNCSTLADGWDRNKEHDNLCVILRKDGKYYLAIRNKAIDDSIDINTDNCPINENAETIEKMDYKYLPSPNKMLPKVFFSKSGRSLPYGPSSELIACYDAKRDGKEDYYARYFATEQEYVTELISFYIDAIPQYGDWADFGMRFKSAEEYEDLNSFFKDVEAQNFFMRFEKVSKAAVDDLVESGRVFLFQIYNKDFADNTTGKKNLHTMYWEYMFSDDNLYGSHQVKLNGEAELFFRPAHTDDVKITHPIGSKLVNRNTIDGERIPDSIYKEIYEYENGRIGVLSDKARSWCSRAIVKESNKDLIKGKRFTQDHFEFHVPITVNYRSIGANDINAEVCNMLADNPACNIIGIDRGERNLLYVSVINQKGEILHQESLNQISGNNGVSVDYLDKLEKAEIARDEARKSWDTIEKIADLKDGYMSAVISVITKLMVKYNAIVVLENLNTGFKRGRFKVERQVYQKFEAALISKLGFIVLKDAELGEPGSIPSALQLANPFESFEKIGSQTGWLFYVPAAYTSKIDPTTGFANLFNLKDLTNFEKKTDFFRRFRSIRFDASNDEFLFEFSYSDFNALLKQSRIKTWSLSSRGERILRSKDNQTYREIPTEKIKSILEGTGVAFEDGKDIIPVITSLPRNNENIAFMDEFYKAFTHILQMRNSCAQTGDDYIISPVKGSNGYYDSREYKAEDSLPCDADANGAFNIARKGLLMISKLKVENDFWKATKISNEEWFDFVIEGV